MTFIKLAGVSKTYQATEHAFPALKNIDLEIMAGEFVAIVGKSGCGKSTLLNMISGIDHPSAGVVTVGNTTLTALNENQMAIWRGRTVGIVLQFFQLLPTLTILENVMLPIQLRGTLPWQTQRERATELLRQVGMLSQANKLPATVSGGQQQRAAIARALANDPPLILADEPTGNLDSETAISILEIFDTLIREGKTIVIVTHDVDITNHVSRAIHLTDGVIIADTAMHGKAAAGYVLPASVRGA